MKTFKSAEDFEFFHSTTLTPAEKLDIDYLMHLLHMVIEFMSEITEWLDNFDITLDDGHERIVRDSYHNLLDDTDINWQDLKASDTPAYNEGFNNYADSIMKDGPETIGQMIPEYQNKKDLLSELEDAKYYIEDYISETPFGIVHAYKRGDEMSGATLIHGTLKFEDIIPEFISALRNTPEYEQLMINNVHQDPESDWWEGSGAAVLCESLLETLNRYSAKGFYFGVHPGNNSDFGYWQIEDKE